MKMKGEMQSPTPIPLPPREGLGKGRRTESAGRKVQDWRTESAKCKMQSAKCKSQSEGMSGSAFCILHFALCTLHSAFRALPLLLTLLLLSPAFADTIESKSGTIIEGKIISRDEKQIVMEVKVGNNTVQRKYGINLIKAITIDGNREVLDNSDKGGVKPNPGGNPNPNPGAGGTRTKAEIDKIIAAAGAAPPDWLAETQLNLPKTLDLSWPEKPQGGWDNQKNIGQFIWDVINPNQNRWREGIKLMYHMMEMHKDDREIKSRAMATMGSMYHHLFQDYARAAYWWRESDNGDAIGLAECYFKLGNKAMALEILNPMVRRAFRVSAIKLYADMGDTDMALKLTESTIKAGSNAADEAMMYAGDACRLAGRTKQAQDFYQKILALPDDGNNKRSKDRARNSMDAIKYFDTFDVTKVPDGTYKSSSLGYEAQVEVTVVVAGGKMTSVKVTNHREKQYYNSINDTPAQIIAKQTVKGVDATSRATITSEAIINATAKAIAGAK